jgi:hypothetical protein
MLPADRPLITGPGVRPEYLKLPRDLAALARSFGIVLPRGVQQDAAALVFAIECADRFLDVIPEATRRARFSASILSCLRGGEVSADDIPPELAGRLADLREVARRDRIDAPFLKIIRELLNNSERMRLTRNATRYVACAIREGGLMVELLLLVLAGNSTPAFAAFMRQVSAPANLGDKLRDARRDFERGEIAVPPTWSFHGRLTYELFRRTIRLGRAHVRNWRVAAWGIQSLFAELIWFPFSKSHSH